MQKDIKFIRGIPDAIQLAKYTKRHDDIVAAEPCPIGEKGKINPHATRYYHADGRITSVFHVGPLYYQTRWNTWESLRDVCTHKGNHKIIFKPETIWKVHPNYITWLEQRQTFLGSEAFVAVDSPYGNAYKNIAKATNLSIGMTVTTFNTAAGDSASQDGANVGPNSLSSWASTIGGNGVGGANDQTAHNPRNRKVGGTFYCNRSYYLFGTSSLGGDTITAASLDLTTTSTGAYSAEAGLDGYLVDFTPGSATAFTTSDFENGYGATKYSDAVPYDETVNSTIETFTLTEAGLTNLINNYATSTVSSIGVRGNFDIDTTPDPTSSNNNWLSYSADQTSDEPELSVTHSGDSVEAPFLGHNF